MTGLVPMQIQITSTVTTFESFEFTGGRRYFMAFFSRGQQNDAIALENIDRIKRIEGIARLIKNTWQGNSAVVFELKGNVTDQVKEHIERELPSAITWPIDVALLSQIAPFNIVSPDPLPNPKTPTRQACEFIALILHWEFQSSEGARVPISQTPDETLFAKVRNEAKQFNSNNRAEVDWLAQDKDSSGSEGKKPKQ